MKRQLGTLTGADLGQQIKGQTAARTRGTPDRPITVRGVVSSVHHFQVAGDNNTSVIVRIVRTSTQIKNKEPDCREIRGPSDTEVEVIPNG